MPRATDAGLGLFRPETDFIIAKKHSWFCSMKSKNNAWRQEAESSTWPLHVEGFIRGPEGLQTDGLGLPGSLFRGSPEPLCTWFSWIRTSPSRLLSKETNTETRAEGRFQGLLQAHEDALTENHREQGLTHIQNQNPPCPTAVLQTLSFIKSKKALWKVQVTRFDLFTPLLEGKEFKQST